MTRAALVSAITLVAALSAAVGADEPGSAPALADRVLFFEARPEPSTH